MPEAKPLLEAQSLVAGYLPGVPILNNCSLSLFEGEISGIVGPNGAGKSTLLKAAFGLVEVWEGDVLLRGRSILGKKPHSLVTEGIGYVPQTENVFPRLSVRENLEMGCSLIRERGRSGSRRWRRCSRCWRSGQGSGQGRSREASDRCWRWAAP